MDEIRFGDNSLARVLRNPIILKECEYGIGRSGTLMSHEVMLDIRRKHLVGRLTVHESSGFTPRVSSVELCPRKSSRHQPGRSKSRTCSNCI